MEMGPCDQFAVPSLTVNSDLSGSSLSIAETSVCVSSELVLVADISLFGIDF